MWTELVSKKKVDFVDHFLNVFLLLLATFGINSEFLKGIYKGVSCGRVRTLSNNQG